jgi:hypothetical protein
VLWLRHAAELHATYGNTFGVISGGDSKWGNLALWLSTDFYLGNLRTEAIFIYGFVGIPLAVLGVGWLRRQPRGSASVGLSPLPLLGAGAIALTVYYFAAGRYTSSDLGLHYHVYSLPYTALATGAGITAVLRWSRTRLSPPRAAIAAAVVAALLGAQAVSVFGQSLRDRAGVYSNCSTALDTVASQTDLVVVSTTSRTIEDGVTNNYQEPIVFFLADRKGWSLAADQHTPEQVASLRDAGARFLVEGYPQLIRAGGPLATWLADNTEQVSSSDEDGCDIWRLTPPPTADSASAQPGRREQPAG